MDGKDFLKLTNNNVDGKTELAVKAVDIITKYMEGYPLEDCLKEANITFRTFINTLAVYPKLLSEFEKAKLIHSEAFKQKLISSIEKHRHEDWRSAAWLLERMFPNEFGKQTKITHETINEDPEIINKYVNADYEKLN